MKTLTVLMVIIGFAFQSNGQPLLDIYKTGTLKLVQEEEYAKGVIWNEVFPDFQEQSLGKPIGSQKSIAVAPDGSVFVGNYSSYSISKFDPNGKHVLTFGQKGSSDQDFKVRPVLGGVVAGKYVFTYENNGQIKLFTLNGKYVKTIAVDYMPLKVIPLVNDIAVLGHVPLANRRVRDVVTIINPETETMNIIRKYDDVWKSGALALNKKSYIISYAPTFTSVNIQLRALPNGNLLVGITNSNQIEIYSPNGELKGSIHLNYSPLPYPEDMKKEFFKRIELMVEKGKHTKDEVAPIYTEDFFPVNMPYYYNFLVDSEGNILVFKFTDEDVDHKFNVYTYDGTGKFIGEVVLETAGYNMAFQYRRDNVVFYKDMFIGVFNLQNDYSVPPKLLRFQLKGE
ncbi:MAG: hypothetical protein PHE03_02785 [Bacteroidales bacterium]|nr:hypothetical protein [Bacteroidales bacterium]MDD3891203.1 hypothetical protein [Bacteroidales bacterium]